MVRDLGALYLTTACLLLAAGIAMTGPLIFVACISWLAFALPHAMFHVFNLEPYGTGDAIANMLVLTSSVLLPVGVLLVARREPPGPH